MELSAFEYAALRTLTDPYKSKGRSESANLLNWFLENIYRLDETSADDCICDKSNDKGVDGIYIDHNFREIQILQSKIRQKSGATIGDVALKELSGTIDQFKDTASVQALLDGNANDELKKIIQRENILGLLESGYSVKAIFVTNATADHNGQQYLSSHGEINFWGREQIAKAYVDLDVEGGIDESFSFDVSYVDPLTYIVDDDVTAYVFPALGRELANLKGIEDGSLFSKNVRLSLGRTEVNKAISSTIDDNEIHNRFALFHNGIIILCDKANLDDGSLSVEGYTVVNGAQSLTTLHSKKDAITDDLRVFVRVIALNDDKLARLITRNSNNQNSIKPRDLRSNDDIMLRLQAEFAKETPEYALEVKRGERFDGVEVISNDLAGRMLLAFDLNEPWSCHQIYKVFDENYAKIWSRRELDAYRIVFMWRLFNIIREELDNIEERPLAKYTLTPYFLMHVISVVASKDEKAAAILRDLRKNWGDNVDKFLDVSRMIVRGLVIDLNYHVNNVNEDGYFDYKSVLKSPVSVKELTSELVSSFEKDVARGKAEGFGTEL